jgi:hypothetical protein
MDERSRRILRWVVAVSVGVVVAVPATLAAGLAAQRYAMERCTLTPPRFPKALSRATEVTVDWTLVPPRYVCVYITPNAIIRRPPP